MRRLAFLALLIALLPAPSARAEWNLTATRVRHAESASQPLRHVEYRVRHDADDREHTLHLLLPDREKTTLQVVDLASSEGGRPRPVATGLAQAGALAGVNGGYFQPGYAPLGLVIRNGRQEHPYQPSSRILTGVFIATKAGGMLLRNAEFLKGFHKGAYQKARVLAALQAGPFLVDRGRAVPGLNATRAAERTILLADKKGVAGLLVTPPMTLETAGALLATPGLFPGLKIERALNLDGGSSTAMWVAANGFSRAEWKRVRNALGVMAR